MDTGAVIEEDAKSEEEKAEKESLEKEGTEQAAEGKAQNLTYTCITSINGVSAPVIMFLIILRL